MSIDQFGFQWLGKILFGAGRIEAIGEECKLLGGRVFLVTSRDLSSLGLTERACGLLESAGVAVTVFDDVQPDPTAQAVDEAAGVANEAECDVIVGLGGGSALDFAKGVAVAASHPGSVWEYVNYTGANARPATDATLPMVAIPTTAGTGSEVTQGVVLHNSETHMKAALLSPHAFPKTAIVDPELTYTMPPRVTAMTGFDALTHGMEAVLNAGRCNPLSDLTALETVRTVSRYLPLVIADGNDKAARTQMSWAATLGGMSIALSGATVAHAMGLPLGARMGTPHGLGLALLLPVVLDYSWQAQPERCAVLADQVGAGQPGMSDADKSLALVEWLREFIRKIGLDKLWDGGSVDEAMLDLLTDDVFAYMGRPVQQHRPVFTRAEIRRQFDEALRA
ncbi:MAG: iron-containing alcohol dehydrogenase [Armatimonadetes bacterium]|nr:iron-containing alcohol dehydrogenase [Armatimonadota bacterium]